MSVTTERTWVTDPARANVGAISAKGPWFLWYIVSQLLGVNTGGVTFTTGLWTCVGSSDHTTAALDGVNRWVSANLIPAVTGTAHSWIVLHNSTLGLYWLIDYISGSAGYYLCSMSISKSAFTGGTTLTAPTSTGSETQGSVQFVTNATSNDHVEMALADNGAFWVAGSKDTTSTFNCFMGVPSVAEIDPSDVGNGSLVLAYSDTAGQVMLSSALHLVTNTLATGIKLMRTFAGTASASGSIAWTYEAFSSGTDVSQAVAHDGISGKSTTGTIKIWDTIALGKRGRIQDWTWANALAAGAMDPSTFPTSPSDMMVIGGIQVPRVGSVAALYT